MEGGRDQGAGQSRPCEVEQVARPAHPPGRVDPPSVGPRPDGGEGGKIGPGPGSDPGESHGDHVRRPEGGVVVQTIGPEALVAPGVEGKDRLSAQAGDEGGVALALGSDHRPPEARRQKRLDGVRRGKAGIDPESNSWAGGGDGAQGPEIGRGTVDDRVEVGDVQDPRRPSPEQPGGHRRRIGSLCQGGLDRGIGSALAPACPDHAPPAQIQHRNHRETGLAGRAP